MIPRGESRQIYLRADARTHEIQEGVHPFKVRIQDVEAGTSRTLAGQLTIWNFALPGADVLPNNCWVQFEDSSFQSPQLTEAAVRDMKESGVNIVFIHGMETPRPVTIDATGDVGAFDDALLRARIEPILDRWSNTPGDEKLSFIVTLAGMFDFGDADAVMPVLSDRWKKVFSQWLKHLKAQMRDMDLVEGDWMLTFADETPYADLFKIEVPVAEFAKSVDPDIQLMTNTSLDIQPTAYSTIIQDEALRDRFFTAFDVYQPNLYYVFMADPAVGQWFVSQARSRGKRVWTYQCRVDLGAMTEKQDGNAYFVENHLYDYYRVSTWRLLQLGVSGTGLWTYCAQATGQKDWTCHLVYNIDGQLVHSRRFEMYREGLDDYRYAALLKNLACSQGGTAPKHAEKLIDAALGDILSNARDPSLCDQWRQRIAHKISALIRNH